MIAYRIAYGIARADVEARDILMGSGKAFANRSRDLVELVERIVRQMGEDADVEAIREAVGDALAGRRPRW